MHLAAIENIFFLILIAIIGLIRWAFAAGKQRKTLMANKGNRPQTPNAPVQRAPAQTEEERVRRFMEALGVPTTNAPPQRRERRARTIRPIDPFPQPRTVSPAKNRICSGHAGAAGNPGSNRTPSRNNCSKSHSACFRSARREPPDHRTNRPLRQEAKDAYRDITAPPPVRPEALSWQEIVRNPNGLRDAIVLREIFGPPRGLQQVFGVRRLEGTHRNLNLGLVDRSSDRSPKSGVRLLPREQN